MSENAALWSATRQAEAIREGNLRSADLLEEFVSRIDALNPTLNAVVTTDLESARAAAREADEAVKRGDELGPLHGLPVTIKDALATAGLRSTGGGVELRNSIPTRDAPTVRAVKDAGAIVFGKTNLPRWSTDVQTYNELFGTTVNPWDPERVPGGSSGGPAAAVAAGLTSFEIATDMAGSIRIPASFCGVFGHKPSYRVVPSSGYINFAQGGTTEADINVVGPIARAAEDLDLLLSVLARDEPVWQPHLEAPRDMRSLRVAAWLDDAFCPVEADLLAVMQRAVAALEADGIAVDREARPDIDPAEATDVAFALIQAGSMEAMPEEMKGITHREWLGQHMKREAIRERWATFFEDYDVILMPASFVQPFPHQHGGDFSSRTLLCDGVTRPYSDLIRWTSLVGMAYLPASVPPIGRTSIGLPAGIQIVGAYGADRQTISLAAHVATLCGGYEPPPIAL